MTTEVWVTLITAVIAPVALKIVTHFFPPSEAAPATGPQHAAGEPSTGVYDIEEDS